MLFNSYIFIFVFLPLTLAGWYGLNKLNKEVLAQVFLIGMSLWFYGYFNVSYLAIILGSCAVNYTFSFLMDVSGNKKLIKILGVIINLGILGYFKYYDFFIENINTVFKADFNLKHILLPLGISFFTFQQMSYVIDRCRGNAPHYSLVDYMTYVTFFPQLIAGPIVLHSEFIPQIKDKERRRFDSKDFAYGICWFIIGLSKKVLLADTLAKPVDFGFATAGYLDSLGALLVAVSYTLQLYLDFSGYCDMAIGIGKMFRLELPDNFNAPYTSASVKEFWRRWHITLGRFFTNYVYIPLGGNRKGKLRQIINTMIVFTLSGLWHGANWTFVVWGILHGIGVSFNNLTGTVKNNSEKERLEGCCAVKTYLYKAFTFSYITLAFVVFRADSLTQAKWLFMRLFTFENFGKIWQVAGATEIKELYSLMKIISVKFPDMKDMMNLVVYMIVFAISLWASFGKTTRQRLTDRELTKTFTWKMVILFVWVVISLSQVSTFLYFNF